MIVDTSVLIAILRKEAGWEELIDRLLAENAVRISAGTLLEARLVAERERGQAELDTILVDAGIEVIPVDREQVDLAIGGFRRFGKGHHPAGLNLGDLFAYALAKSLGEPLLFNGNDFSQTDVQRA